MFRGLATVLLLVVSNAFMTLAWYGHIAFKSRLERFGLTAIVLLSWGIALFEYCFQVPANRIGSAEFGGPFSIWELKVIQEVPPRISGKARRIVSAGHSHHFIASRLSTVAGSKRYLMTLAGTPPTMA